MIITCKKDIPLRWIALAILPWASFTLNYQVLSQAFVFSLKKFVDNPAGLTFVLSLPTFISIVLGPIVSFVSDRIWTRFGRRKPFVCSSMTGMMICLTLLPLMPNFWALLAVFLVYSAFADLNAPIEPLKLEIIPPHERGRATGAMQWISNLATMTFFLVALGRFDDVRFMAGVPISGEQAIYWSAALLVGMMLLLVMLGIREMDQKSALRGQRLTVHNFFSGLLDRELWPVYLLVVGAACMNFYSGLGVLMNLLYTDQWGYTKQEMGINVFAGGLINFFVIGLLTVFADKLNRMRAYQTLICLALAFQVFYYCYVNFMLPDRRPTLIEIIAFGETLSIIGMLTGLVYVPLVYDYIRRNKMGTYAAGANLVTRAVSLITLNGVGLFVWVYAVCFQPPAGEMTRIVLHDPVTQKQELQNTLRQATWTYPMGGIAPATGVCANAWQADGTVTSSGRGWEVRLRDKEAEGLAAQRDQLTRESSPLVAEAKLLRDSAEILRRHGDTASALEKEQKAAGKQRLIDDLKNRTDALEAKLKNRADEFHNAVARVLGTRLITEGDEVLNAVAGRAIVLDLSTTERPDAHVLESILRDLRHERPDVIDLRPLKLQQGYGVALSALLPSSPTPADFESGLQKDLLRLAQKRAPKLFPTGEAPLRVSTEPALTLDLMILEAPVTTYVSPITRAVNFVQGLFGDPPDPNRRLAALARSLRLPAETNHVRADQGTDAHSMRVTAVLANASKATSTTDSISQKLQILLGPSATPDLLAEARAFFDRIDQGAAVQRITVAHPLLTSAYAPMKYDYMSGYLWMFVMSFVGICITLVFSRFEARGYIHKRGVEEAQAS